MNENKYIFPVDDNEFNEKVIVKFNNINEGFCKFKSFIIENKSEEEIIDYICNLYKENGFDNFYIDLYLDRIKKCDNSTNEDAIMCILKDTEDKTIYRNIKNEFNDNTHYYKISVEALPLIIKLGTREMLFSTFYAAKTNTTVWSNYALKFPVFYL